MMKIQRLGIAKDVVFALEQQITMEAVKGEVCGLLAGKIENTKWALAQLAIPLPNLSRQYESFAIDPEVFHKAKAGLEKDGKTVLALYHSHPYGSTQPSFRDLEIPKITSLLSLIVAPTKQQVYAACYGYAHGKIYPVEVIAPVDPT